MKCINSDGCYLTVGKYYEVQYRDGSYIAVVNDLGKVSEYSISQFE